MEEVLVHHLYPIINCAQQFLYDDNKQTTLLEIVKGNPTFPSV